MNDPQIPPPMKNTLLLICLMIGLSSFGQNSSETDAVYIRLNQYGFTPESHKSAIVFSKKPVKQKFSIVSLDQVSEGTPLKTKRSKSENWGAFDYYYQLDFSEVSIPGEYRIISNKGDVQSQKFKINDDAYQGTTNDLLDFMRQQRCGYNPFLDMVCHQSDGRIFYGIQPDSSYVNASGGWHDAGDQLKYLITGSYATAHMLKTFELYPDRFDDLHNALGQESPNGIPDILDEAKWGLDWILKLHFSPDQIIHQIADDRDHRGWKMPNDDPSDYGWGSNSYRAAYVANGKPQGLNKYQSQATGVSNVAGRCAAALSLGASIFSEFDTAFSIMCREAAISVYDLGKSLEGFQQGNSFGAPYRYNEQTWADDMEWGAAELYRLTSRKQYLEEAKDYALQANTDNWLVLDSAAHYQYYPFINLGHFVLHGLVDEPFKRQLEEYYHTEITYISSKSSNNPYGIGIPFIWCSNNLMTSFITQIILYEKMTGDTSFNKLMLDHRDWLFGKNPWGTSMFTGMPADGEYPLDVHTSVWAMTKKEVRGGLIDGPIFMTIYNKLLGLELSEPDEFAAVQNQFVTYHDDIGDYSTNEPTMDGTAGSMIMMAHWSPALSK